MKTLQSFAIVLLLTSVLAACGPSQNPPAETVAAPTPIAPTETEPRNAAAPNSSSDLRKVVLGMGFIPNIQFAPFYVADARGYFKQEGLELEFKYGTEDDLLKLIGTDKLEFAIGSGDQVILARSQGLPAVYVANFYRQFPVSVASVKEKNITVPKDLEGKTVGIPGLYGASYIGWLALSHAAGIDTDKVNLQSIGFTQPAALEQGLVDAAVVYIVNTPVLLRMANQEVNEMNVSDYINLVSNGIITNEQTIGREPELVRGMVQAFLKGLQDTIEDPAEALELSLQYVPEAGGENRSTTDAVLEASILLWRGDQLGISKQEDWEISQDFMKEVGLIDHESELDKLYTNTFVNSAAD